MTEPRERTTPEVATAGPAGRRRRRWPRPRVGGTLLAAPSRVLPRDLFRLATIGPRARPLRAALSATGIAIGIAAMVAVLGISASSRAELLAQLDALGTNLLTVAPGSTAFGQDAVLPDEAPAMIERVGPVTSVTAVAPVDATVRRTDLVPEAETGGIAVKAARPSLLSVLGGEVRAGRFLDRATERYPAVVLGSVAAQRLGIDRANVRVWLGGRWFAVVGILEPLPLAPDLDRAALVGFPIATEHLDADDAPGTIYVRTADGAVDAVMGVLPATASPERPEEVDVTRPSDALAARAAADAAFTALLLGLGGVALLVGGVGIANVMVVAVLERRSEIGLRRALGATRRHIAAQFLGESLLIAFLGGMGGALLGGAVTALYAGMRGWQADLPPIAIAGAAGAALVIGAVAGLYPAVRAARLAPTDALRSG